jgi:hypothetical protein
LRSITGEEEKQRRLERLVERSPLQPAFTGRDALKLAEKWMAET